MNVRKQVDIGSDNPRLQCERCGKWRRLVTKGEQCMFYWAPEHDDFVGDTVYQNICTWCIENVKAALNNQSNQPTGRKEGQDA